MGCATIAATDQAPVNTRGVDVHDQGLRTATRSADAAAPRAPRREMVRPVSTNWPHIAPCEQPNASETSTDVTSCATQAQDDGYGMASAGEAEPDTALVLETTEAAPGLAPPTSAQAGSGHRRQLNNSPSGRSTPTRRGRSDGRTCRKEHGPQPSQEPRSAARGRDTSPITSPASQDNTLSPVTVGIHDRGCDSSDLRPPGTMSGTGQEGGTVTGIGRSPGRRRDEPTEISEPLVCGICLQDVHGSHQ